jgi:Fur family ferric uptake transcriptional regulator
MNGVETKQLLRNRNIRATAKKVAILRAIIESPYPINAGELHANLSGKMHVDLATIYRTLAAFKKSGIIREINDTTGVQYVEIAGSNNPEHPHFKCMRCLKLYCLDNSVYDETIALSQVDDEFVVHEISVMVSGICKECNRSGK